VQFDVKGIKTKIAARQLIGTNLMRLNYLLVLVAVSLLGEFTVPHQWTSSSETLVAEDVMCTWDNECPAICYSQEAEATVSDRLMSLGKYVGA